MNPEQQRIAIAKQIGWQLERKPQPSLGRDLVRWIDPSGKATSSHLVFENSGELGYLPDFTRDLNAMHEAERILIPGSKENGNWYGFVKALGEIVERDKTGSNIHATASQRAEAFLRTLGLWCESK